jgi:hypothetical protein
MMDSPGLINYSSALSAIDGIQDPGLHDAIQSILAGVMQFLAEQPSQLRSPFDIAFFVEILKDRMDVVRRTLDGTDEWPLGGWEPSEVTQTSVVDDPAQDVLDSGIRFQQAWNYIARCQDQRIQGSLLALRHRARTRQSDSVRPLTGKSPATLRPDAPFDFLFMVMAIDHVLRPGQPARLLLDPPRPESGTPYAFGEPF